MHDSDGDEIPPDVTSPSAFAVIPRWLHRAGLSDRAFRIYCILAQMQGSRSREAHPSRTTLARMTKSSTMSVHRALLELRDVGAIFIEERVRPDGGRAASGYVLNYHHPALEGAPGLWTDTPPVSPVVHPLSHGWYTPSITGDTPKNKNHKEEQPKEEGGAKAPTPRGETRKLTKLAEEYLHVKWDKEFGPDRVTEYIADALNHKASLKAINLKLYVDKWLTRQRSFTTPALRKGFVPDANAVPSETDWDV